MPPNWTGRTYSVFATAGCRDYHILQGCVKWFVYYSANRSAAATRQAQPANTHRQQANAENREIAANSARDSLAVTPMTYAAAKYPAA